MDNAKKTSLSLIKKMFISDFVERDAQKALSCLSDKVHWYGTGADEDVHNFEEAKKYINDEIQMYSTPYNVEFLEENEYYITDDITVAMVKTLVTGNGISLFCRATATNCIENGESKICSLHMSVPDTNQKQGEYFPYAISKVLEEKMYDNILNDTFSGGIIGTYCGDDSPIFYINFKMLKYLGYNNEDEFKASINDSFINAIHPDDRIQVLKSIKEQMKSGSEYAVIYRITRKNGDYIWIDEKGKKTITKDGKQAYVGICFDITEKIEQEKKYLNQTKEITRIYNAIPGGAFKCKLNENFDITFANDGFYKFFGYTREEFKTIHGNKLSGIIDDEDRFEIFNTVKQQIEVMNSIENVHKVVCKNGNTKWIYINGELINDDNNSQYLYCLFVDVTKQKKAELALYDTSRKLDIIIANTPGGIMQFTVGKNNEPIIKFISNGVTKLTNLSKTELYEICKNDYFAIVHKDDYQKFKDELTFAISKKTGYSGEYRIVRKDSSFIWISLVANIIKNTSEGDVYFASFTDITNLKETENVIKQSSAQMEALISNIPGGTFKVEIKDGKPIMTYVSEGLCKLLDLSSDKIISLHNKDIYFFTHPDDYELVKTGFEKAIKNRTIFSSQYRIRHNDGHYIWVSIIANIVKNDEKGDIFYGSYTDISKVKKQEQILLETEKRYELATSAAGLFVWEYDIKGKRIIQSDASKARHGFGNVIENVPQSLIEADYVAPESILNYYNLFKRINDGEEKVFGDFWFKNLNGDDYWCERITYYVVLDENKKPIRAYGAGHDITELKMNEKRFNEELAYRETIEKSVISTCRINLTKSIVEDRSYKGQLSDQNIPYDNNFRLQLNSFISDKVLAKKMYQEFSAESLLSKYRMGSRNVDVSYFITASSNTHLWVNTTVNIVTRPETGDVIAFMYTKDFTKEKNLQDIMNRLLSENYDEVGSIDCLTGDYTVYSGGDCSILANGKTDNYRKNLKTYIDKLVAPYDRKRALDSLNIENIKKQLQFTDMFKFELDIYKADSNITRRKQIKCSWLNKEAELILLVSLDIDDILKSEKEKQDALEKSLKMAQEASKLKSEFLARMSHEIRTPMNAIIGLAEIASNDINNKQFILDCLQKSKLASNYLLSLLNDILDMSKIEKGKIKISYEQINMKNLFTNITTIISAQAENANVNFLCDLNHNIHNYYIGDATRLEQILINLLTNAVKFTEKGGNVKLIAKEVYSNDKQAELEFTVSDTGIGISPDFLPKIFDTFAQEHDGISASYGGSGLGLSIARSLARLMQGDITVKSELGKGTIFTVNVILGIDKSDEKENENCEISKKFNYNFSGKKILLVEDQPLNTLIATHMLENQGFTVVSAENGEIGLNIFAQSELNEFSAILMDIRMPIMDGLTAAKNIRKLNNADAKTIPIVAMTANAYDEDIQKSLNAGMNAHISKPIISQLLFDTLYGLINNKNIDLKHI